MTEHGSVAYNQAVIQTIIFTIPEGIIIVRGVSNKGRQGVNLMKPVVALAGSHRGADTAIVVTPSYSASILDTVVHEMICKAFDIRNPDTSMTFE